MFNQEELVSSRECFIRVSQGFLGRVNEKFLFPRSLEDVLHAQILHLVEIYLFVSLHKASCHGREGFEAWRIRGLSPSEPLLSEFVVES
jgi:hypothetical protein